MKVIYKDYIKFLIIIGLTFSILNVLSDYIFGIDFHFMSFIFDTLLFGGIMSLIFVSLQFSELKKRGYENKNVKLVNEKIIKSNITKDELLNYIKNNLFFKNHSVLQRNGLIVLQSNMTFNTWGEVMTIELLESKDDFYKYRIISKPKWKLTFLDGGANLENIMMMEQLFSVHGKL